MGAVFLLGVLITGVKFLDAREMATIFARLRLWTLPALLILPMCFLWLKAVRFADLFQITGPPISQPKERHLTRLSYISAQLATLLPGGYVARIGLMQASLGLGARAVLPTLVEKLVDLALLGVVGLLTCLLFPDTGHYAGIFVALILVTLLFVVSSAVREKVSRILTLLARRIARKSLVRDALSGRFPERKVALKLALQTLGVLSIEVLILWASFFALGLQAPLMVIVLGYTVSDLIGRVAPTPGGFGLTEVGMVAMVTHLTGMGVNGAAAGTFLFRFLLFLLPALYGSLCYLFGWIPATARK
jgi:uncharacterized protein (TIRG00374 family)